MQVESTPSGSAQAAPHQMRITNHQKMQRYIEAALKFLSENAEQSLTLHTLPIYPADGSTSKTPQRARPTCTDTVPRLISIVEILKREFLKTNPEGLHQYNEVGCLEDLEQFAVPETEETRDERILRVLSGKNHLKIKRSPYMQVTLSRVALPHMEHTATYQKPVPRKYSKAQKARAKKRAQKAAAKEATETDQEHVDSDRDDEDMESGDPESAIDDAPQPTTGTIIL